MRQIKFRGVDYRTNKTHYGFVESFDEDLFEKWYIQELYGNSFRVFPVDNIAQLVEVTADGIEIYEGDIVERDGKKFVATLEAAYHAAD